MKKLPFVTKPKTSFEVVGNEEVGQIKLLKVNGRLAAERVELDEEEFRQTRLQLDILKLARDIASLEDMQVEDAFKLLQSFNLADPVLSKYIDAVSSLLERQLKLMQLTDRAVTAVIRHRIVDDETGKIGLDDWAVEDTQSLSDPLINAVYEFYLVELNGGKKRVEAEPQKGEETEEKNEPLKKDLETENQQNLQTGEKSSGESNPTESTTTDSAPKTSEVSPIG